uniref:Uncharacterized protein n=2 Tax=Physcomitrium patens TaxID=3218 RepID=A0A2K1KQG1_PHYPA|nr:hypothetical protein PHYPA_006940 [Physcomitrium patens]
MLQEDIYTEILGGFQSIGDSINVVILNRDFYSLKQVSKI